MKNNIRLILIIASVIILITSAVVWAFSPKKDLKPSDYGIGTSYDVATRDTKPIIALFYTDWCTYCMRFMPKYKLINDLYKNKYNFVMLNADAPENAWLVSEYAIGGYPTIYIIDPKLDNRVLISNTLYDDLYKVRKELDRYLRIRSLINIPVN